MAPEESRMIEKELHMSREQLLAVILDLRKREAEETAFRAENSRALTAMAKDYRKLMEENKALRAENDSLKAALAHLSDTSQLRANGLYGRATERMSDILDGLPAKEETDEDEKEPEDTGNGGNTEAGKHREAAGGTRRGKTSRRGRKKKGKRQDDISKLPKKQVFLLDIPALDEQYGEGNWRIAFWHSHFSMEEVPSYTYALFTYTPVISVGLEHCLVTIPYESSIWPHSFASPSITARVLYNKYFLSLPLYRQEMMFADLGVCLSRQTLSSWILHFAFAAFGPVYEYLYTKLLETPYHQCDETTLLVNRDGRAAGRKSYLWLHATSELSGVSPVILFCFELTRGTDHLREFYKDFEGFITCDAYCSYQTLSKEKEGAVIICGCMMHMRRRFVESLSLIDKSGMDDDAIARLPETKALTLIGEIYHADEPLKTLTPEERQARRDAEVRPLVEEYFHYIESLDTSDPAMGERLKDAINYSKNQKEYLCRFLSDGNVPCDNGFAERCIRPVSTFRRNSLFCDSITGAKATAVMYTAVETAHANGANVYWYLRYVLEKMPRDAENPGNSFMETMMPWSEAYREYEKMRTSQGPPVTGINEYRERPKTPRKKKTYASDGGIAKTA